MRFILQVSKFRLHPDVRSLYTPMYRLRRPGCTSILHPGLHKDLLPAKFIGAIWQIKNPPTICSELQ